LNSGSGGGIKGRAVLSQAGYMLCRSGSLFQQVFYFQSALNYAMATRRKPAWPSWERDRRRRGAALVALRDRSVVERELVVVEKANGILSNMLVVCKNNPVAKREIWKFFQQKKLGGSILRFANDTWAFYTILNEQLRGAQLAQFAALTKEQRVLFRKLETLVKLLPILEKRWNIRQRPPIM